MSSHGDLVGSMLKTIATNMRKNIITNTPSNIFKVFLRLRCIIVQCLGVYGNTLSSSETNLRYEGHTYQAKNEP